MIWTTEKPTVPGWYWWRKDGHLLQVVNLVDDSGIVNLAAEVPHYQDLGMMDGEWAGPLEPPQ